MVTAAGRLGALERALDWLADGIMLVRPDRKVVYANRALHTIARRDDGIAIRKGAIEFAAAEARGRFAAAMASVAGLRRQGSADAAAAGDFCVPRRADLPVYIVAVRPLPGQRRGSPELSPDAIVYVRDPLAPGAVATHTLRELFGLTEAEARLAQALEAGDAVEDYAAALKLSLNTVYTHLRRVREKTGCTRMAELIRKLNVLRMPLRPE